MNGAILSPDKLYRYRLWRDCVEQTDSVAPADPYVGLGTKVCWILLNPSTADHTKDDATVRKCRGFSQRWGYDRFEIVNLFAIRSRDPKVLYSGRPINELVGFENDFAIESGVTEAQLVVCAWGRHGNQLGRGQTVRNLVKSLKVPLYYLKLNKDGTPAHPLMLPYSLMPQLW
jgi:hypothetical protein